MEWLIGKRRFPNALIHLAYPLSVKVRAGLPWAILLAGGHPLGCSARLDARQQANSPHAAGLDDRSLGRAMPSFRSVCAERWSDHQFTPPGRSPDDGDTARSGLRRRSLQTCCPLGRAASVDDAIIERALMILEARARYGSDVMSSPDVVKKYLRLRMGNLEHEVFSVLWLDSQNRVIKIEELFRGTLAQASVYPREVVKAALACNAAAVILAHNHPSGVPDPSTADIRLTQNLKEALALVDVKVLDHIVVCAREVTSFAENGLI